MTEASDSRQTTRRLDLAQYVDNFRWRVLQDALHEAEGDYWLRRAEQMEAARPQPGEYAGKATPEDLAARDARLAATALACRRRAQLALLHTGSTYEAAIEDALAEQVAS